MLNVFSPMGLDIRTHLGNVSTIEEIKIHHLPKFPRVLFVFVARRLNVRPTVLANFLWAPRAWCRGIGYVAQWASKTEIVYPVNSSSPHPSSRLWRSPFSLRWSVLHTFRRWDHAASVPLRPASFSEHDVLWFIHVVRIFLF